MVYPAAGETPSAAELVEEALDITVPLSEAEQTEEAERFAAEAAEAGVPLAHPTRSLLLSGRSLLVHTRPLGADHYPLDEAQYSRAVRPDEAFETGGEKSAATTVPNMTPEEIMRAYPGTTPEKAAYYANGPFHTPTIAEIRDAQIAGGMD